MIKNVGRGIDPTLSHVGPVIDPPSSFREPSLTPGQRNKGLRAVWQPRFWEHTVRDEMDFAGHLNYIHYNPVKHAHVKCPLFGPWSTFAKWVRAGVYKPDWYCGCEKNQFREPDFEDLAATAME